MKTRFIAGFLFFFLTPSLSLGAERITLVADAWCPYNCEPNAGKPGFMIEVARDIFRQHGIDVDYKILPWGRAIQMTREGKFDAIVGAYKTDAPDFIFPALPMAESQQTFYATQNSPWKYTSINSLKGLSLGTIKNYSYGDSIDNYIVEHPTEVQAVSGEDAVQKNINKLLAGRIQTFVEDRAVMNYYIANAPEKFSIKEAGHEDLYQVYIAFSPNPNKPNSARYAKILSEGLKDYKSSGKLKAVWAKYGS